MRAPPRVQILSISYSFLEILAKSDVGASPIEGWRSLPRGIVDPALVTEMCQHFLLDL